MDYVEVYVYADTVLGTHTTEDGRWRFRSKKHPEYDMDNSCRILVSAEFMQKYIKEFYPEYSLAAWLEEYDLSYTEGFFKYAVANDAVLDIIFDDIEILPYLSKEKRL